MFREMRRNTKELSKDEAENMLQVQPHGTLALDSADGYPYSLPISFAYGDGKIYFHGAVAGQKYESLQKNCRVSLSVIEKDNIQPGKFTTYFKSAIAFGTVRMLTDEDDIRKAMELILLKYSPEHLEGGRKYVDAKWGAFAAYEMSIDHLTAKGVE